MKITDYGKSCVVHRWQLWMRWWRHPERELMRRQFRRGIGFWKRWPWNFVLILTIVVQCMLTVASLFGAVISIDVFDDVFGLLLVILMVIAWVNRLQDDGMNYFRGSRLGELLITPSGPRRYFPALLMAPIGVLGLMQTIWFVITIIGIVANIFIADPNVQLSFYYLGEGLAFQLMWEIFSFVETMAIIAGMTARVAAWSIGDNRTAAIMKSVLGFLGVTVFLVLLKCAVSMVWGLLFETAGLILLFCIQSSAGIGIGLLLWHTGLKKLRGPKTVVRLQKAMESSK